VESGFSIPISVESGSDISRERTILASRPRARTIQYFEHSPLIGILQFEHNLEVSYSKDPDRNGRICGNNFSLNTVEKQGIWAIKRTLTATGLNDFSGLVRTTNRMPT
jgi:hypothetical protein